MFPTTNGRGGQPPHVVIVGGGFGGLYATAALSPADIAVLLPFSRPPRDSASSLRRGREGRGFGHEDCPKGPRKVARSAG